MVTLDLDFANIQRYPPANYGGIMVLRLGTQARGAVAVADAVRLLEREILSGRLWIVESVSVSRSGKGKGRRRLSTTG